MIQRSNSVIKAIVGLGVILTSIGFVSGIYAAQPTNGYFTGVELEPIANATIADAQQEPAVALVFSLNDSTTDITRQFNEWYSSATRPQVHVFAVAVNSEGLSHDAAMDVINQREMTMPVLLAGADILFGDDIRLSVLNEDQEVQRFTTLDFNGVNSALTSLGVAIPQGTPAPVASPGPAATPSASVDSAESSDAEPSEAMVLGGPNGNPVYRNLRYGFEIEFPPNWKYRIAGNQDGAVAITPGGGRLDLRVWATEADGKDAQEYMNRILSSLSRKHKSRVNIRTKAVIIKDNQSGLDIWYTYTRPLDPSFPAVGSMLYRGRMQVFLDGDTIKAAAAEGPAGEFSAAIRLVESFFRKFTLIPSDTNSSEQYNSPNI